MPIEKLPPIEIFFESKNTALFPYNKIPVEA
jgi:hypothetical protein